MKHKLYHLLLIIIHNVIMKNFLRFGVGVHFSDTSHLKHVDQFLFIGNHNSHLDTPSMMASVPPSKIIDLHPVAAADYFDKNWFTRLIIKLVNARFIYREKVENGPNTMKIMTDIINEGKSIIIFPEGTRGIPDQLAEFKVGVAVLLQRNPQVPFVPVYMHGMAQALPRGDSLLVPFNCYINVGNPCYIDEEMSVETIIKLVEIEILKLKKNKSDHYFRS